MIGLWKRENQKYGRIRNASVNVVPLRAALVVLVGAMVLRVWLGRIIVNQQHTFCESARAMLALQEQNYEHWYHHYVVGDEDALEELVRSRMARWLPKCKAGGHYTAIANADGTITIRCSLPEHNESGGTTRRRFQRRRPAAPRTEGDNQVLKALRPLWQGR